MKQITSIILLFISISLFAQDQKETELESSIEKVTVFFESAQIYRVKKTEVKPGKSILKFIALSPYIDAKSVQVKVIGDVTVLSVNHNQNFTKELKKSDALKRLEIELKDIQEKLNLENTYLGIINEEISFLQSNKVIGGRDQVLNLNTLKEVSSFYGSKMTELKLKDIERRRTINQYNLQSQKIVEQIRTITSKKEYASGEVLVTLDSKSAESITLEVSYMVGNAGWLPSYDIRAKSVEDPLELVYKANVHQDTKVDWDEVKLVFSSVNPNVSGLAPELFPYLLNYSSTPPVYRTFFNTVSGRVSDNMGQALIGAVIQVVGTTIGTISDNNGNYSLTIPSRNHQLKYSFIGYKSQQMGISSELMNVALYEDAIALQEVEIVSYANDLLMESTASYTLCSPQISGSLSNNYYNTTSNNYISNPPPVYSTPIPIAQKNKQTSVEFEVEMPYSIKADSKNYVVNMVSYNVPAYFEYLSIPMIDNSAFLIANITDWENHNLLDGEANLFFEGTYVGKSLLDLRYTKDTLSISLGIDKQVIVERKKVKDYSDRQFIGNKKEDTRAWEFNIKNNKLQAINMVILDQIPVPSIEEIELDINKLSSARYNDENGEVKWKFTLGSKKSKNLDLRYSFKYPKNRNIVID